MAECFNLPEPQFLHPEDGMPHSHEGYVGQSKPVPIEVGGLGPWRKERETLPGMGVPEHLTFS